MTKHLQSQGKHKPPREREDIFQPNGEDEYSSREGNVPLEDGHTHFHNWESQESWKKPMEHMTITTTFHLSEEDIPEDRQKAFNPEDLENGGSVKIHQNVATEEQHTDNVKGIDGNTSGTDNVTHKGSQNTMEDHDSLRN